MDADDYLENMCCDIQKKIIDEIQKTRALPMMRYLKI